MKTILLFFLSLGLICSAVYFQQQQRMDGNKISETYLNFQKELEAVEADENFLRENYETTKFLIQKGWISPHSRLKVAAQINQLQKDLNGLHFRIEPEIITEKGDNYSFKVSKIVIEIKGLLDSHVYEFIHNILKNFPGILILRSLALRRGDGLKDFKEDRAVKYKRPSLIMGEIVFDWFALGKSCEE